MKDQDKTNFHIETLESGVKVLYLHVAGKVNVLKLAVMEELNAVFDALSADPTLIGLVITSARPDIFIAGADIGEIDRLQEMPMDEAYRVTERGKQILQKLSSLGAPTVAAIDGSCKGGGLELAMWCNFRLVSDNPRTVIALPESRLGLIPGFGGCVLACRLMKDPLAAVQFIASGADMSAEAAWKAGLVDEIVSAEHLLARAEEVALSGRVSRCARPPAKLNLAGTLKGLSNPITRQTTLQQCIVSILANSGRKGRQILAGQVVAETKRKGKGYISPAEAARVIMKSVDLPFEKALELESQVFAQMAQTSISKNLVDIFLDRSRAKQGSSIVKAGAVRVVGVVGGAGAMGKEIGFVAAFTDAIESVVLVDMKQEFLARALADISKLFDYQVRSGKLTCQEKSAKMSKFVSSTDYGALASCDVIIEAVRENIEDKHAAYAKIDTAKAECTAPYWIFSNTSALSLGALAEGTLHPERFGGLHFFNPVSMMPLVECGEAEKTDAVTMATGIALASAFGKLAVPCRDKTGFIVNRILGPEIILITWLLSMGVAPKDIDKAMLDRGFPMGAVTLFDQVGLDIIASVAETMRRAFGARMDLPPDYANVLKILLRLGHLGKKSGKGIYLWNGEKPLFDAELKCNVLNPALLDAFPQLGKMSMSREAIQELLFGVMENEALRALADGVVDEPFLIDLAMIFGAGFPPFLGGPIRHVDQQGVLAFYDLSTDIARSGPETWRLNFAPGKLLEAAGSSRRNIYTS